MLLLQGSCGIDREALQFAEPTRRSAVSASRIAVRLRDDACSVIVAAPTVMPKKGRFFCSLTLASQEWNGTPDTEVQAISNFEAGIRKAIASQRITSYEHFRARTPGVYSPIHTIQIPNDGHSVSAHSGVRHAVGPRGSEINATGKLLEALGRFLILRAHTKKSTAINPKTFLSRPGAK